MDKIKIIIFGDHCCGYTAYGRLVNHVADSLYESNKFDVMVVGLDYNDVYVKDYYSHIKPYPAYSLTPDISKDPQAIQQLSNYLFKCNFDILLTINDIWQLWQLPDVLNTLRNKYNKSFIWSSWFPVDQIVRRDWLPIINYCDAPITMSSYGYKQLKKQKIKFHKIKIDRNVFYPIVGEDKEFIRKKIINKFGIPEDSFVFAFVGKNQERKNIFDLIKVFKTFKQKYDNAYLYLHTEPVGWGGNIAQYCEENNIKILMKLENFRMTDKQMNNFYNSIDCLIVPSISEGVCLPIYEAQLTGTPVIGADNTSITESLTDSNGFLVKNDKTITKLLTIRANGIPCEVELPVFDHKEMFNTMEYVYKNFNDKVSEVAINGMMSARIYQDGLPDWAEYFLKIYNKKQESIAMFNAKRNNRYKWVRKV